VTTHEVDAVDLRPLFPGVPVGVGAVRRSGGDSPWARRRLDHAAGRDAARRALEGAGLPAGEIRKRADGSPWWPDGVVGSIAHDAGWAVAVAGRSADAAALGLDVTADVPIVDHAMRDLVLAPAERRDDGGDASRATVVFAAKEAVFKAVNPRWGIWLEHHDLWLDVGRERFTVVHGLEDLGVVVAGRWRRAASVVLAGCVVGGRS
jgi:4'-phosphopantetheinyl transferase EntD